MSLAPAVGEARGVAPGDVHGSAVGARGLLRRHGQGEDDEGVLGEFLADRQVHDLVHAEPRQVRRGADAGAYEEGGGEGAARREDHLAPGSDRDGLPAHQPDPGRPLARGGERDGVDQGLAADGQVAAAPGGLEVAVVGGHAPAVPDVHGEGERPVASGALVSSCHWTPRSSAASRKARSAPPQPS